MFLRDIKKQEEKEEYVQQPKEEKAMFFRYFY